MAAFVIAPLAKMAAAAFAWLLFRPREGANEGTREALDTSALDTLATSEPASTSAASTTSTTSVPLATSSNATTPTQPLTAREVQAVLQEPATSTPQVPAHWVRVATSEPASTSATSIPLESDSEVASPVVNDDSAIAAARQLHAYVLRTPRSARDRVFIRARQAAMGGVTVDGLIGRQTAARIRELTGLRLPGLS